jgi:hypothetical protein
MSSMVLMVSRADSTGPELRIQMAGVVLGKQPPQVTHLVLRQRSMAMELGAFPRMDCGGAMAKDSVPPVRGL